MRHTLILLFLLFPIIAEAQQSVEVHSDLFSKKRNISIKINGDKTVETPAPIIFMENRGYRIRLEDSSNRSLSEFEFKIREFTGSSSQSSPPSWYTNPNAARNNQSGYQKLYSSTGKSRSMEISFNKGLHEAYKKAGIDAEENSNLNLLNLEVHKIGDYYEVYLLFGEKN